MSVRHSRLAAYVHHVDVQEDRSQIIFHVSKTGISPHYLPGHQLFGCSDVSSIQKVDGPRSRCRGSSMWTSKMVRAGVVVCGSNVQRPLRALFLQRCSALHFTFVNSLHPVSLANPSSALRKPIHTIRSNCPHLYIATFAVGSHYHARQVFA